MRSNISGAGIAAWSTESRESGGGRRFTWPKLPHHAGGARRKCLAVKIRTQPLRSRVLLPWFAVTRQAGLGVEQEGGPGDYVLTFLEGAADLDMPVVLAAGFNLAWL